MQSVKPNTETSSKYNFVHIVTFMTRSLIIPTQVELFTLIHIENPKNMMAGLSPLLNSQVSVPTSSASICHFLSSDSRGLVLTLPQDDSSHGYWTTSSRFYVQMLHLLKCVSNSYLHICVVLGGHGSLHLSASAWTNQPWTYSVHYVASSSW
jgi:hypothetical protein